jgi:hypothetical protein
MLVSCIDIFAPMIISSSITRILIGLSIGMYSV